MTCQELRLYFEDPLRQDDELRSELEHLAHCTDCARFVEAQRELGNSLRLVREAAPKLPATLDAAVLAGYRRHSGERPRPVVANPRRQWFALLRWGAVAAAVILAAVLFYRSERRPEHTAAAPEIAAPVTAAPATATTAPPEHHSAPKQLRPASTPRHPAPSGSAQVAASALPPGFRSLMYCDELSCSDAMEVIRVQLPSSAMTLAPAARAGGPVFADVLVGSDGIARGIRVVE